MANPVQEFGQVATGLSRNPLGIIALFIVMVYGFATLVITVPNDLTLYERVPLVVFLVLFPFIVLGVFGWLVSHHAHKLFGPSDYRSDESYLKAQEMTVAMALGAARATYNQSVEQADISGVMETVREVQARTESNRGARPVSRILWVDDKPDNNQYERDALSAIGIQTDAVESTEQALLQLQRRGYAAIVSDLGRPEGDQAGFDLLEKVKQTHKDMPFFIYTARNDATLQAQLKQKGATGGTNNSEEIFRMIALAVHKAK